MERKENKMTNIPEELILMREREIERIRRIENRTENTAKIFLAGAIGYLAGSSSRNLAYVLGFLSLGCFNERFQCENKKYDCEGIEIVRYEVGNEFSNEVYVDFIETNGKKYLPRVSESGNITGLLEAKEIIIDINTGEVKVGGLEMSVINTENTTKMKPRTNYHK